MAAAEDLIWAMRGMVVGLRLVGWRVGWETEETIEGGAGGGSVVESDEALGVGSGGTAGGHGCCLLLLMELGYLMGGKERRAKIFVSCG